MNGCLIICSESRRKNHDPPTLHPRRRDPEVPDAGEGHPLLPADLRERDEHSQFRAHDADGAGGAAGGADDSHGSVEWGEVMSDIEKEFEDAMHWCYGANVTGKSYKAIKNYVEKLTKEKQELEKHVNDVISRCLGTLMGGCKNHPDIVSFNQFVEAGGSGCPLCLKQELAALKANLSTESPPQRDVLEKAGEIDGRKEESVERWTVVDPRDCELMGDRFWRTEEEVVDRYYSDGDYLKSKYKIVKVRIFGVDRD